MLIPRYAHERGHATHGGWLKSAHTFSFADYYDRNHMNFSALRVINEDYIAPNNGFGAHPHKDMEILTYVLEGEIEHQDSMGNREIIPAGEFQIMSAGTGVVHSEVNPSNDTMLHLYQIWIMPNVKGVTPRYEQKKFAPQMSGTLILSPEAENGSFKVYQDMKLWRYTLNQNQTLSLDESRVYWLQVVKGEFTINGTTYKDSDAIGIVNESKIEIITNNYVEFLLFDLPKDR